MSSENLLEVTEVARGLADLIVASRAGTPSPEKFSLQSASFRGT